MKKLFALTTIIALGTTATFAQGYVNFNNVGTGQFIYVEDSFKNGGLPVIIGTPATAAGFSSSEGKGAVRIALYAAANGTSTALLAASTPIWTGLNSASGLPTLQGTVAPGIFGLPSPFDGSAPVEFAFFAVSSDGLYQGWSNIATQTPTTAADALSGIPAVLVWGAYSSQLNSFIIGNADNANYLGPVFVPEPATIALGGIGALTLLLFRRRK